MKQKSAPLYQRTGPHGETDWYNASGILFKKVFPNGQIEWFDEDRQWHRDDGPALEAPDGTRAWLVHGKEHRENGPAIEFGDGTKKWYRNGKLHRDDGPAEEFPDGRKEWWRNGRRLKPDQIKRIMEKKAEKIAEPFRTGLDHAIKVRAIGKLKTKPSLSRE